MPASRRTMKSAWIGIGFSHHNVPSLSNTATRSLPGTPAATVPSTNSTTARRAGPSLQLASIPGIPLTLAVLSPHHPGAALQRLPRMADRLPWCEGPLLTLPDLGPTRARAAWRELGVDGLGIADEIPGPDFPAGRLPKLATRMVARLQGFPDSWRIAGRKTAAYRQVGNAFPPPV